MKERGQSRIVSALWKGREGKRTAGFEGSSRVLDAYGCAGRDEARSKPPQEGPSHNVE